MINEAWFESIVEGRIEDKGTMQTIQIDSGYTGKTIKLSRYYLLTTKQKTLDALIQLMIIVAASMTTLRIYQDSINDIKGFTIMILLGIIAFLYNKYNVVLLQR